MLYWGYAMLLVKIWITSWNEHQQISRVHIETSVKTCHTSVKRTATASTNHPSTASAEAGFLVSCCRFNVHLKQCQNIYPPENMGQQWVWTNQGENLGRRPAWSIQKQAYLIVTHELSFVDADLTKLMMTNRNKIIWWSRLWVLLALVQFTLHPSIQNNGHCPRRCTLPETLPMFALEKLQSSILRVMKKEIRIGRRKRFREKGLDIKL